MSDRRRHKYGVSDPGERTWNGRTYDSRAECVYAMGLWALLGIEYLEVLEQPRITLGLRECVYVPDFLVIEISGAAYYVDVKGVETPKFKRDRRLYRRYGRLPLVIVKKRRGGGFVVAERIEPKGERPDDDESPLFGGASG